MLQPSSGVEIRDRKWHLKTYKECFVGMRFCASTPVMLSIPPLGLRCKALLHTLLIHCLTSDAYRLSSQRLCGLDDEASELAHSKSQRSHRVGTALELDRHHRACLRPTSIQGRVFILPIHGNDGNANAKHCCVNWVDADLIAL
jgi:hypothetical protein